MVLKQFLGFLSSPLSAGSRNVGLFDDTIRSLKDWLAAPGRAAQARRFRSNLLPSLDLAANERSSFIPGQDTHLELDYPAAGRTSPFLILSWPQPWTGCVNYRFMPAARGRKQPYLLV